MSDIKRFQLGGKAIELSYDMVVKALQGVDPGPVQKYYIEVGKKRYPVKQALSRASNLSLAAFTSQHAFRILQSLGFDVKEE